MSRASYSGGSGQHTHRQTHTKTQRKKCCNVFQSETDIKSFNDFCSVGTWWSNIHALNSLNCFSIWSTKTDRQKQSSSVDMEVPGVVVLVVTALLAGALRPWAFCACSDTTWTDSDAMNKKGYHARAGFTLWTLKIAQTKFIHLAQFSKKKKVWRLLVFSTSYFYLSLKLYLVNMVSKSVTSVGPLT